MDLTVKERILLHLFDYSRLEDAYEAPLEATQTGIAQAVGTRISHISQYLKPLLGDGEILERTSRIKGGRRRRKVYFLTATGRQNVASFRSALWQETVPLRHLSGETEEVPLSLVFQEVRRGTPLLRLLQERDAQGYIAESLRKAQAPAEVDYSQEAPRVETFYGRTTELKEIHHALAEVPLVVVAGIAGMGKTALAAKIRDELRGTKGLLWRRIQSWDSPSDLLRSIAGFLRALGRFELSRHLRGTGAPDLARTEELLLADLTGLESLFIFDDVQNGSEECRTLFRVLHGVLRRTHPHTWTMMLTRELPRFYSRRDVKVNRSVVEFGLKGLGPEASQALLADSGVPSEMAPRFVTLADGHPLFLKLLAASRRPERTGAGLQDLEAYITEEIVRGLDENARTCMEVASLFEIPVPSRGLLLGTSGGKETLFQLHREGLLDFVNGEVAAVHDRIRAYFRDGLAPERKGVLLAKIVPWMLEEAERRRKNKDFEHAIALLENVVAVDPDPSRLRAALRRLGFVRGFIGDFKGAVEAYRQAIPLATSAMERAWLHRAIAETLVWTGQIDAVEEELNDVENLISKDPSRERALLQINRADAAYRRATPEIAFGILEDLANWLPTLPRDPYVIGRAAHLRGFITMTVPSLFDLSGAIAQLRLATETLGEGEDAEMVSEGKLGEEAVFRAEDTMIGHEMLLPWSLVSLGWAAVNAGQEEEGFAYIDRAVAMEEESGFVGGGLRAPFAKAELLMVQGRFEEAEELFDQTFLKARQVDPRYRLLMHYMSLWVLYYWDGRLQEARETLEYLLAGSEPSESPWFRVQTLALLVNICTQLNDLDAAERFAGEAEALANENPTRRAAAFAAFARAALQAVGGEIEEADSSFRAATMFTPWHVRQAGTKSIILLEYGRFLAANSKKLEAREVLQEAYETQLLKVRPMEKAIEKVLDSLD